MVIASIALPHTAIAVDTLEPVNLIKPPRELATGNSELRTANPRTTVSEHIRVKCRPPFTEATVASSICQKSYSPLARRNGLHLTETTILHAFDIRMTFR